MASNPEGTQNVLDQMTAEIGARKAGKGPAPASLTPVGVEPGGPLAGVPEVPGVFLTNEALRDIAADLRAQAAVLIEVADGLDSRTGLPTQETRKSIRIYAKAEVVPATPETFDAKFAAQSAAAQAAVYGDAPAPNAQASSTWKCPDHPRSATQVLTSRKGRKYAACTVVNCQQTERLGAS